MRKIFQKDLNTYMNYLIVAYAFSFPISKAGTNGIELLLLILWLIQGHWSSKLHALKSNLFIVTLGAFLLWSLISLFWASDISFALSYIGKYHHFLMIPIIYTTLEKRYIKYIFSAFVLSMLISEVLSYSIYFGLMTYKHATPQFPTPFMHHVTYSAVLVFTTSILLISFFKEKILKYKIFYLVFFITATANLFVNGGRTGQLIFIILIFVLFLFYIKHKMKAILIASIVSVATLFLAYQYSNNFASRVEQLTNGFQKAIYHNDYTDQGGMRTAMIIIGTYTFLNNFALGTGIGNTMKDANKYSKELGLKTRDMNEFADYHNIFINIAAQLGVIGIVLLLTMFYILFKTKFISQEYDAIKIMFVVTFILYSCTHNSIHVMNGMVFFALFTGLLIAISRLELKDCKPR